MNLPELKAEAKSRKIKGFSTMKKADLVAALAVNENLKSALDNSDKGNVESLGDFTEYADDKPSLVEAIQASIRNAREARRMKGMEAGLKANVTAKVHPDSKVATFRSQRNGGKLTAKQARRVRKTRNRMLAGKNVCTGMGASYVSERD